MPKFPRLRRHTVKNNNIYGVPTKTTVASLSGAAQPPGGTSLWGELSAPAPSQVRNNRPAPAPAPAAPQHLSGAGRVCLAPACRGPVCPRGQSILRPPERAERTAPSTGVPLTCALAARAEGGGAEAAQPQQEGRRTASHLIATRLL